MGGCLPQVHCYFVEVRTERNLSGRLVSLAAWQFLLFHHFVPRRYILV